MTEETPPRPVKRLRHAAGHALAGFAFGYVVLHPIAMVIFRHLSMGPQGQDHAPAEHPVWGPIVHSFAPGMIPMGLVFALLTALMAAANGFLRATVIGQRDELRRRADRLLDLERRNRRTARFLIHDFKNRLGVIVGVSEHLLRRSRPRLELDSADALRRVLRQGQRILASVRDLLDLARLEERPGLDLEDVCAADLLARVGTVYTREGRPAFLTVASSAETCPDRVRADVGVIERVIENLLDNAVVHNRPGTRVVLSLESRPRDHEVVFRCQDDGAGIPEDLLPRLFEEFSTRTRTDFPSSGLGLAFCREAVEAHGGRIWCEDADGRGSRFCFTLPRPSEKGDDDGTSPGSHRGRRTRLRRIPGHDPAGSRS